MKYWESENAKRFRNDFQDPRHGTTNGYSNLKCRCAACQGANAKAVKESRLRRAARAIPDHVHGSENGYGNYMCRCRACTDAWSYASNERLKRRKKGRS